MDMDSHHARGEDVKAKLAASQLRQHASPAKLLIEVPQCQLDMHVSLDVPDDRAIPMEAKKLVPGSPEAKVALLHYMLSMCDPQPHSLSPWHQCPRLTLSANSPDIVFEPWVNQFGMHSPG